MDVSAVIQSFSPKVQPYIKEILYSGNIGICAGNLIINEIQTGRPTIETTDCGDRFKLIIPFAGQSITWEIVFNSLVPQFPPDFCFDDDSFLSDPEIEVSLLSDYSRLNFEYSSLMCQTSVGEDDVEVLIGSRGANVKSRLMGGAVNFLIRLKIDFSDLPPVQAGEDTGESSALLLVTFYPPEGSRIAPQLYLSPRVEKALGGSSSFHLPQFPGGSCLMDYVPVVVDLLKDRVASVALTYEKKKEYLAAFILRMGKAMLEYDSSTFSQGSFLLECRDFYFVLHVVLPMHFPKDRPIFTMQSVYHSSYGKPYKIRCEDYPYSPRWEPSQMVERACTYITGHVDVFQRNSIQSCPI
ncbi:BRCA1-A complex subunit BRE [Blattella germanica]|nr:BRCA1-A complex subunit BRE [Blattella germanica]